MSDQVCQDEVSHHFPILQKLTFLDHAGVAPISGPAAEALRAYAEQSSSAAYCDADWQSRVRQIKQQAARLLGARGEHEIAFCANTCSGLAMVANGLDWREGDNVVLTNVEYPANRYPWEDLGRKGVKLIEVPQLPDGRIDPEDVMDAITNSTRIVAISHVQYASGHRIDLRPISDMAHRAMAYLCVDAIQSLGALRVDVQQMGIDFLAADGHKWLLSPEGCGLFYCHEELCEMLHPTVVGWMCMADAANYGNYRFELLKDARRFEPGSYNIPSILALGASIDLLLEIGIDAIWSRIHALTTQLCDGLAAKGYRIFNPRAVESECSGIVTFDPPPQQALSPADLKRVVADLQKQGIVIVVREGRLRASPHFYNTPDQIDRLTKALP